VGNNRLTNVQTFWLALDKKMSLNIGTYYLMQRYTVNVPMLSLSFYIYIYIERERERLGVA
jgi:hypothetical protein